MSEAIDKMSKLAAGAHAWEEEVGRIAGDLHPSTNITNDLFGEIAFAVLVPRAAKAILPYLGERPDFARFHHMQGAKELGLHVHDYRMIAPRNGKREKIRAPASWIDAYKQRAHLIYSAGIAEIEYDGDLLQQQDWRDRAQSMESIVTRGEAFPPVHAMPHVANLVYRAMRSTARNEGEHSVFRGVYSDYERELESIGEEYTSDAIGYISDRVALALVSVSDRLVQDDLSVWRSGKAFESSYWRGKTDGDRIGFAGRAVSQILVTTFLKAAEKRNLEAAALMSDIAYCGWAMMLMGEAQRYVDPDLGASDLLEHQWGLGINVDPYTLRVDEMCREESFQKLLTQVPDLRGGSD